MERAKWLTKRSLRARWGLTQSSLGGFPPLSASPPPPYPPTHPFLLAPIGPLYHTMSNGAPGLEPSASKALMSFLICPRVPTALTETVYPWVPSTHLEPLKMWDQQLPAPSPEVVHIPSSDVPFLERAGCTGATKCCDWCIWLFVP